MCCKDKASLVTNQCSRLAKFRICQTRVITFFSSFCAKYCAAAKKYDLLKIISVTTGRHACCVNTFHTSEDAA